MTTPFADKHDKALSDLQPKGSPQDSATGVDEANSYQIDHRMNTSTSKTSQKTSLEQKSLRLEGSRYASLGIPGRLVEGDCPCPSLLFGLITPDIKL